MKNGMKLDVTLSDVVENESLTFSGAMLFGMMRFMGAIKLAAKDAETTTIHYTFEMAGCMGVCVSGMAPGPVVDGTEKGLENMVRLSELRAKEGQGPDDASPAT